MKYLYTEVFRAICPSHPARGAWIEILRLPMRQTLETPVAPRKGCVD